MKQFHIDPLDMPQGEAQDLCPPCPHCGNKAWIVDGTGNFPGSDGRHWLLCILHDEPITTVDLPDHLIVDA
jgi:hypothetical protein